MKTDGQKLPCSVRPLCERCPSRLGFTLIELMLTLSIGMILSLAFISVVYWQTTTSLRFAEQIDARQQGQALWLELQHNLRGAAYGFVFDDKAAGQSALGACLGPAAFGSGSAAMVQQFACTSSAGDQLLIASGQPLGQAAPQSLGSDAASQGPADNSQIRVGNISQSFANTPAFSPFFFASGTCASSTSSLTAVNDELMSTNAINVDATTKSLVLTDKSQVSCSGGYASSYRVLGEASYLYRPPLGSNPPSQLLRSQRDLGSASDMLWVDNLENFVVRYGIDTSATLDGRIDHCPSCTDDPYGTEDGGPYAWCRDPRGADKGGTCLANDPCGQLLSSAQIRNRIVAVHVSYSVRSARAHKELIGLGADAFGYRHFPMQALVSVRSRSF